MIKLTQSLGQFLFEHYPTEIPLIMFGHLERFTDEMQEEYMAWLNTDYGRSFLKGGENYTPTSDDEAVELENNLERFGA